MKATGPMIAVGYAAQMAGPDGTTTLILANGRTVSISAAAASALNVGRQNEGLSAIPVVSQSQAEVLKLQLAKRSAGGQTPADEGS